MHQLKQVLLAALLLGIAACTAGPPPPTTAAAADDRVLIDARDSTVFAHGHAPGALNIQLEWGQLGKRTRAYVPDLTTPIGVRCGMEDWENAVGILADLGYQDVAWLASARDESEELETWSAPELAARLASDSPPTVIDVRSRGEQERGSIPGALLLEQDEAPKHVAELDPQVHYAVICEGGVRSSQFASLLRREGFPHVVNVIDGMSGWRALEE